MLELKNITKDDILIESKKIFCQLTKNLKLKKKNQIKEKHMNYKKIKNQKKLLKS